MKLPEGDFLGGRRRALEDSFFAERDRHLLDGLRKELHDLEDRRQLAHVSSILDEKVLQALLDCGIRGETLAAIRMIPLVEVAWCDGHVSPKERDAVLRAATENGIAADTACYQLLADWLARRPDPRLIESWKEYVGELGKVMPGDSFNALCQQMTQRIQVIAEAAGGFLGVHKISQKEQETINELCRAMGK